MFHFFNRSGASAVSLSTSTSSLETSYKVTVALSQLSAYAVHSLKEQDGISLFDSAQEKGFFKIENDFNTAIKYYNDMIESKQSITDEQYFDPNIFLYELKLYQMKFQLLDVNSLLSDEIKGKITGHLRTIDTLLTEVNSLNGNDEPEERVGSRFTI